MNFFKHVLSYVKQWFSSPHTLADEAHSASIAIKIVAPGLVLALQEAGVQNAGLANVSTEVANDLDKLSNTLGQVAEGSGNVDEVVSVLESIKANLGDILTIGHIKNPELRARVVNAYNAFEAEAEVIVGEFTAAKAPVADPPTKVPPAGSIPLSSN
jgi:hypothetical protein